MSAPATVIRWQAPPPPQRKGGQLERPGSSAWIALADELRAHQGEWAVIYEGDKKTAHGIAATVNFANVKCLRPAGDFEATTRKQGDFVVVYARYLGDGDW